MHAMATSLLNATVELTNGKSGVVVAVYPSAQFGLQLLISTPDGEAALQEAHSSEVKKVTLASERKAIQK